MGYKNNCSNCGSSKQNNRRRCIQLSVDCASSGGLERLPNRPKRHVQRNLGPIIPTRGPIRVLKTGAVKERNYRRRWQPLARTLPWNTCVSQRYRNRLKVPAPSRPILTLPRQLRVKTLYIWKPKTRFVWICYIVKKIVYRRFEKSVWGHCRKAIIRMLRVEC